MRRNLPITQREVRLKEGGRLITTTDLNGVITYCNDEFVAISGFAREELLGQNHNIIRHPDMPPLAFQHMWDHLKAGKAWMGVVKNRSKNGDHYWVSAYVTPIFEKGRVTGYESVRVAPTRVQVSLAEKLYSRLNNGKPGFTMTDRAVQALQLCWPPLVALVASVLALLYGSAPVAMGVLVGATLAGLGLSYGLLQARLGQLVALRPDAFRDGLIAKTYTHERGRFAELSMLLLSEEARLSTALARIDDQAIILAEKSARSFQAITEGREYINRQRSETDQTASAINEMTASIQEVADNVTQNAREADETNHHAAKGAELSRSALVSIEQLVERVHEVGNAVEALGKSTESIGEAADLISGIAEQTNLLALNAAIEAARAGEQGRGFAVVADEVRNLASRTRESTSRIHDMVEGFRNEVSAAVSAAREGEVVAGAGLDKVRSAERSLSEIADSIARITDRFMQMSAAVEQQSQVSDEINRQVINIAELADASTDKAGTAAEVSGELDRMASGLHDLVARFTKRS